MSFSTASAILRGRWLLDKQWAQAHMSLVVKMMKGEAVDFGSEKDIDSTPKVLSNKAGSVYRVSAYTDLSNLPEGSVGMLTIAGPIMKYGDYCAYGSIDHTATINRLANSPNVAGVILDVDTPGGEASGTAMLADAIKNASLVKPVIAFINDGIAASAGMWIISPSTEIYTSQKTDMVGSVGVYTTIMDWYGYFEAQGLKVHDIYAPQSEEKNLAWIEAIKNNDNIVKEDLKILAAEFISTVQNNRAGKLTSDEWSKGKMFYTKDAIRIGLIDGQKSFDQVIKRMNSLISKNQQQSNTNSMAFTKTLAAAKAEKFEVVEGGFLLEEAHLNNIEASIEAAEANTATIADLQTKLDAANAEVATSTTALIAANDSLTATKATIISLNARIVELGKEDAGTVTTVSTEKDATPSDEITDVMAMDFQQELLSKL